MKTFNLKEKDIELGYIIGIDTLDKADLRTAEISYSAYLYKFVIFFNGKLIHSCKGFQSVLTRLNKLDIKFPLENDYYFI